MTNMNGFLLPRTIIAAMTFLCVAALMSGCSKPDFFDTKGQSGQFSDFHGKWVVINYWAEWCEPCREEIPEFNQLASEHTEKLEVLSVPFDRLSMEELAAQVTRMGIEYRTLISDPAALLGLSKPNVLPVTYIMKPDGSFFKELLGPQTKESIVKLLHSSK